jgi:hypothetical protein
MTAFLFLSALDFSRSPFDRANFVVSNDGPAYDAHAIRPLGHFGSNTNS